MAVGARRDDDFTCWDFPVSVANDNTKAGPAEARCARQMALMEGVISDYEPALRELAKR